eukprot:COSAG01_NODE_316_length_19004_cov_100.001322_14_plen_80_part_00
MSLKKEGLYYEAGCWEPYQSPFLQASVAGVNFQSRLPLPPRGEQRGCCSADHHLMQPVGVELCEMHSAQCVTRLKFLVC